MAPSKVVTTPQFNSKKHTPMNKQQYLSQNRKLNCSITTNPLNVSSPNIKGIITGGKDIGSQTKRSSHREVSNNCHKSKLTSHTKETSSNGLYSNRSFSHEKFYKKFRDQSIEKKELTNTQFFSHLQSMLEKVHSEGASNNLSLINIEVTINIIMSI